MEACSAALHRNGSSDGRGLGDGDADADADSEGVASHGEGGTGRGEREERFLVVDMDESGTAVRSARSLSRAWAVLETSVGRAPTWDEDGDGARETVGSGVAEGRGLMLRVEGIGEVGGAGGEGGGAKEGERAGLGISRAEEVDGEAEERLRRLLGEWEDAMGVLRRILDAGGEVAGRRDGEASMVMGESTGAGAVVGGA